MSHKAMIVDSEELDRFANHLRTFNTNLQSSMQQLNAQFRHLGDLWKDQEHQKFAQEFEQTMRIMSHFIQVSDRHIPFLHRKAQRVRDYIEQG